MTTERSGSDDVSGSMELLWRPQERAARGPKPGLTLDQIVTAAVAVAGAEGLGPVSMRRVAAELCVGTMSLYRYVPGKGELSDLMLDKVVECPAECAERRTGVTTKSSGTLKRRVLEDAMRSGRWPTLAALSEDTFSFSLEQVFESGLEWLLNGLASFVEGRALPARTDSCGHEGRRRAAPLGHTALRHDPYRAHAVDVLQPHAATVSACTARAILRTARLARWRAAGHDKPCRVAAASPPRQPGPGA